MLQAFVLVFLVAGTFGMPSAQEDSRKIVGGVYGANNVSQTDNMIMTTHWGDECEDKICVERVKKVEECVRYFDPDAACRPCMCKSICDPPPPTTTPPTTTTTAPPPSTTTTPPITTTTT